MNEINLERLSYVKSKLLSKHTIKVKNNWISEAIEFLCSESPNITNETLCDQVFEQFILSDVKDSSNLVIPQSILQKKESFTLYGVFVLQMMFLIDISESPYEQWRRLHNIELDDVQESRESKTFQTKKKRMFKLELTDGFNTVTGMEYKIISKLNTKLSPGCKIQIKGPLQVVNHIMLLESENVNILGGDVEDLQIINAYENVLLRALNKPTTKEPIRDYNEPPAVQENQNQSKDFIRQNQKPETNVKKEEKNVLDEINFDDDFDMVDLDQIVQDEKKYRVSQEEQKFLQANLYDDETIEIYDDRQPVQSTSSRSVIRNQNPYEIMDDEDETEIYEISRRTSEGLSRSKIPKITPTTYTDETYAYQSTNGFNFVTIDQYLSMKTTDKTNRDYVIFTSILNIEVKSLRILDGQWQVRGDIFDDYSHKCLEVQFDDKIIQNLSGYSGSEMEMMYKSVKTRPQVKDDITAIINQLQQKLSSDENRFMRIKFRFSSVPNEPATIHVVELLHDNDSQKNLQTYQNKIRSEKISAVEPESGD